MGNWDTFFGSLVKRMAAGALDDLPDRDLVRLLLAGVDEPACEAVVRRHGPMVYRVCWRALRNEADAEDAFQATFLVLALNLRAVRDHASLASWLHGIARRVALKARARAATRARHERGAARPEAATAVSNEMFDVLDAELRALPERWRLPLVLCYLEGRTQDEVAVQLGWGKNTLRRRLDEARAALARRMVRRGVLPAAAVLLSDCAAGAAPSDPIAAQAACTLATGQAPPAVAALTTGVVTAMFPYRIALALALTAGAIALAMGDAPAPKAAAIAPAPDVPAPPVPAVLVPKAARKLEEHTGTVRVMFSADGAALATFSDDTTVLIRDPASGKVRHRLAGHRHPVVAAAFSPDGTTLVTADFKTVRTWDVASGKAGEPLPGIFPTVQGLAYAPDGKSLAVVSGRGNIELWAGGKVTRSFAAPAPEGVPVVVSSVRFSPDGKLLVVASTEGHPGPSRVRAWDPATGKVVRTVLETDKGRDVWAAVFSPDGKRLAVGDGRGRVTVFATADWTKEREFETGDQLRALAFAPDSRTLAAGLRRDVQVWDVVEGKRTATLEGHGNWVLSAAYSRSGALATGSSDKTARLWGP